MASSSSFKKILGVTHSLLTQYGDQEWDSKNLPHASAPLLEKLHKAANHLEQAISQQPSKEVHLSSSPMINNTNQTSFSAEKEARWQQLRQQVLACTRCPHLVESRTQVVFGVGNPNADLMFVGEAPGEEEDHRGEPFVGRAGQLLTKILSAMEYQREDIFIANVLKCRPNMPPNTSGNRKPRPEEMETCLPWLRQQIEFVSPKLIVALGATAMEGLIGEKILMREARGQWFDFEKIPLMVTYHPAYLLRNQSLSQKRKVWEDMLQVLERLGRPISSKQRGYFLPQS